MAAKPVPDVPSTMPPPLSLEDTLLASRIPLPSSSSVAVALYRPNSSTLDNLCAAHDVIELARRQVLSRNTSPVVLDNILPSVRCGKEPALYLFLLTTQDSSEAALHRLSGLQPESLDQISHYTFPIEDLLSSEHAETHTHFLEAVRSYILSDLSETTAVSSGYAYPKRLADGFILEKVTPSSDWASGWGQGPQTRPTVHFRLQIQVSCTDHNLSHLIVHALPFPTPYSALPSSPRPGLPIILLPYGTPAYFLNIYRGPCHILVKQFRESLKGLGAGTWEGQSRLGGTPDEDGTPFVVGWIRVENRQGEDKGTLFIWPRRLCLSYQDAYAHRQPLGIIPEMPSPLQASPQLPSQEDMPLRNPGAGSHFQEKPRPFQYEPLQTATHPNPLRAFESFTTSKSKDIRSLANEVGGYVDSVVRERERERERLKKERELAGTSSSPKLARSTVQSTPAPTLARIPSATSSVPQVSHSMATPHPHTSLVQQAEAFYPSPPQSGQTPHPAPTDKTSPEINSVGLPPEAGRQMSHPQTEPTTTPSRGSEVNSNNYDTLFNHSSTWIQSSTDNAFMDIGMDFSVNMDMNMDIDMDMGFSMNMNMDMPPSGTTSTDPFSSTNRSGTLTFDAFTDDDFSFFDQPSKSNPPPPPMSTFAESTSLNVPTHSQPAVVDSELSQPYHPALHHRQSSLVQTPGASGPGPPYSAGFNGAPWTPATQGGGQTPNDLDSTPHMDLMPSTPVGVSPDILHHHPSPETPTVQLTFDPGHQEKLNSVNSRRSITSSVLFDPIPFSTSHKNNDGKYSHGKFAFLPSPSPEPGYDPTPLPTPTSWRRRYNSLTDPRIGVVKQLIGVKRKASSTSSRPRPHPHETDWMDVGEGTCREPSTGADKVDIDVSSDSDSEDGLSVTSDPSDPSPLHSRPCTPLPSYIPPGPSLLHFQFCHASLLPLSKPLRSPGASPLHSQFEGHDLHQGSAQPFASVPTPVSPAAAIGVVTEQSKSLESAAHAIAVEFVENTLWAEVWRVNNQRGQQIGGYVSSRKATIWPDDMKAAAEIMKAAKVGKGNDGGAAGLCTVAALFELDSSTNLVPYSPPSISIGKGDAVVQVLPTALRFWQKLGLGPKGGRKDVEVYSFYEDSGDQRRSTVDAWLTAAGAAYTAKHMGQFIRGCTNPANDALLPVRFDASFRKALALFASNIIGAGPPIVVILFVPVTSMTFASPSLRSVLSSTMKILQNSSERQIIFHYVPDSYLIDLDHSPRSYAILDEFCMGIYNRIHVEVERNLARQMGLRRNANLARFQEPAFTLARPSSTKVSLLRSTHTGLDVVDRFTFLHIGYQISQCRKWIFACCIDQRGEEYESALWLVPALDASDGEGESLDTEDSEANLSRERIAVERVWAFATRVAKKADVEWRMVVTKLGRMSSAELQAWTDMYAQDVTDRPKTCAPFHLVLASADHRNPLTLIQKDSSIPPPASSTVSPTRLSAKATANGSKIGTQFCDNSVSYYALFPATKLSVVAPHKPDVYSSSIVSEPISSSSVLGQEGATIPHDFPPTSSPKPSTLTTSTGVTSYSSEEPSSSLPRPVPFIPLSSSILVRVPLHSMPVSMLQIHILKTIHPTDYVEPLSIPSTVPDTTPHSPLQAEAHLIQDLTKNFYELSLLSSARFHLDRSEAAGIDPVLPLHLSAVEVMRFCVEYEWDGEATDAATGGD
ncbi:hypothetical protein NMY22_g4236 [Coprinellus aureogranulatus]|nr:hypothetical protein NMY22_g4236 [Coprinellus aureogranulatus]